MPNQLSTEKRVLIVGLGIAGMSSAIALQRAGWHPVIVEKSRVRRQADYYTSFDRTGRKAAEKLGVLESIHQRTPEKRTFLQVDQDGQLVPVARSTVKASDPAVVLRSDIENGLWSAVEGEIEVRFSTRAISIEDGSHGLLVLLENSATGQRSEEQFDLLIGADGMRSTVRRRIFGPDERFLVPFDSMVCQFDLDEPLQGVDPEATVVMSETDRALGIFPFSDRQPAVRFAYRTKNVNAQSGRPPIQILREVFAKDIHKPVVAQCLDALERTNDYLFDSVHQVHMDSWRKGRVILLGDSAWCLTLYSGMGTSAALHGGVVLGECFERHPESLDDAIAAWERRLRPFIWGNRVLAGPLHEWFVPSRPLVTSAIAAGWKVSEAVMRMRPGRRD
ncbi:FAD-dependent monooxygenase [Granulicoccus sp. GXG6511]|uniref:FAD-dependent monooxygenase n=1 Tax=Granulicoccus sp. GXG6511 TaxID=3381351 RepID=UPI003D7CAF30